jgi:hypothetical protein
LQKRCKYSKEAYYIPISPIADAEGGYEMRCPKCGYVSFDHNATCPKCNKDISLEQTKMNLPAYMPDPPRLLDALTDVSDDSPMDFDLADNINQGASLDQQMGLELDETGTVEKLEDTINQAEETVMYSEPLVLDSIEPDDASDLTPPPLPKGSRTK